MKMTNIGVIWCCWFIYLEDKSDIMVPLSLSPLMAVERFRLRFICIIQSVRETRFFQTYHI